MGGGEQSIMLSSLVGGDGLEMGTGSENELYEWAGASDNGTAVEQCRRRI